MTIQDILKSLDFTVGDIKSRVNSGVISLNGDVVNDVRLDIGEVSQVMSFGHFLSHLNSHINFGDFTQFLKVFGFDDIMHNSSNIKNELTLFLNDWSLVRTSAFDGFFIKHGSCEENGILFHIEGTPEFFKKVVINKASDIDVDKLISDLEKVNKQLSNQGFLNNAPKFKVDQCIKRKEKLEKQILEFNI